MRYATRIVALSIVALLLFLVGALAVQTWLNRQHSQIQAEAIAAKRVQFDAAAQLTADRPDRWSPPHLNAIGEVIQAHVQRFSSDMPRPPAGIIRLLQPIPGMAEGGVAIDFEMPHVARLSLLHGRTWGLLLVGCLAVMVLFIMLALATARRVNTETRTPWPATKTEMGSLEQLARASAAQGDELAREREMRRRIERDLSLHQQLQTQALEGKIRLGRDLHDGLIQSLYAVGLTIESVRPQIRRDPAKAEQRLEACLESLNQTIRTVRAHISGLNPEQLRQLSFAGAARHFFDELRGGRDATLDLVVDEEAATALTPTQTTEALQIIHEALSNALRHGAAEQVVLRLHRNDQEVGLLIKDNGVGFNPQVMRIGGHGVANMHARAAGIGATLRIDSAPGTGTRIVLTMPVPPSS